MSNAILDMLPKANANTQPQQQGPTNLLQAINNAKSYVNEHGGDPKKVAIELLKQRGYGVPNNPWDLISQLIGR